MRFHNPVSSIFDVCKKKMCYYLCFMLVQFPDIFFTSYKTSLYGIDLVAQVVFEY